MGFIPTALVTLTIIFLGTISFGVTSFGGDIVFQIGWQFCYLINRNVCNGDLLAALGIITIVEFIKYPIQVNYYKEYINYELAMKLSIPQVFGTITGLLILTEAGANGGLKCGLGILLLMIVAWQLYNWDKEIASHLTNDTATNRDLVVGKDPTSSTNTKEERFSNLIVNDVEGNPTMSNYSGGSISNHVEFIDSKYNQEQHKDKQESNNGACRESALDIWNPLTKRNSLKESILSSDEEDIHLFRRVNRSIPINKSLSYIIYLTAYCAGILGGMYGTSGPPLMILASYLIIDKYEWIGSVCVAYLFENITRFFYLIIWHRDAFIISDGNEWYDYLIFITGSIIASLVGLYSGNWIGEFVDIVLWKKLLLVLLVLGSVLMIYSGALSI